MGNPAAYASDRGFGVQAAGQARGRKRRCDSAILTPEFWPVTS
jgi:hypothetical protein